MEPVDASESYKKQLVIGAVVIFAIVASIATIALLVYNNKPQVVYQPFTACDLFSSSEAKSLLGNKVLKSGMKDPVYSGDVATSTCGYTDGNPDMENVVVAAISVRSGVNDDGVKQNEAEFDNNKPSKGSEPVKNLGDKAYFNKANGQLNVLDGRKWVILSYGVGAAPETNSLDKAVALAKKVLH